MSENTVINHINKELVVPHHCKVPVIPGDGIGPEIWNATKTVLDVLISHTYHGQKHIEWVECLAGQTAYEKTGEYLPKETSTTIKNHLVEKMCL